MHALPLAYGELAEINTVYSISICGRHQELNGLIKNTGSVLLCKAHGQVSCSEQKHVDVGIQINWRATGITVTIDVTASHLARSVARSWVWELEELNLTEQDCSWTFVHSSSVFGNHIFSQLGKKCILCCLPALKVLCILLSSGCKYWLVIFHCLLVLPCRTQEVNVAFLEGKRRPHTEGRLHTWSEGDIAVGVSCCCWCR